MMQEATFPNRIEPLEEASAIFIIRQILGGFQAALDADNQGLVGLEADVTLVNNRAVVHHQRRFVHRLVNFRASQDA